jgi:hypothetical protein
MKGGASRIALGIVAGAAAVSGVLFGILAAIIYSDFVQRGCHHIPSADWIATANCTDASNAMWMTGLISAVLLVGAAWSVWRLRHA